jgi:hypothetical protein
MNATTRAAITAAANPDPVAWAASIAAEGQDRMAAIPAATSGIAEMGALNHPNVGGSPSAAMNAYEQGRAAALVLFGKNGGAERGKFQAGEAAARALLGPVIGGNTELAKFNAGQTAARRLLGKTATTIEAN